MPSQQEIERTVEEIAETVYLKIVTRAGIPVEHIAEALQAERQKRDQELQKARHDWLREEIVKLEGMYIVSKPELDFVNTHIRTWEQGHNHGISEIVDRYQSELDQPTDGMPHPFGNPEGVYPTKH